ncbi:MAG: hypothetical protein A3F72_21190 [Bacteroidetes bacterium RIFCSPLOWO2_12_FULL_35_15]|nr:MAG: hypothetical protein A3F72_21190 [Bacteroidetes bacterium RIFCSPLOWO2_12_FULL_35_15]
MTMKDDNNISCSKCVHKKTSIFKNCPSNDLDTFFSEKKQITFSRNKIIIKQGEVFNGIVCIKEGIAKVFQTKKNKEDFIFWFAKPGDLLGVDSFINKDVYSYSVMAVESTKICLISKNDIDTIVKKKPEISIEMIKLLCERIDYIEKRMVSIAQKGIKEQLAEVLLLLSHKSGNQTNSLTISYSIKDLANIIGTTKNYIYKLLSEFSQNKIVSIENRTLKINDVKKLSKISLGN